MNNFLAGAALSAGAMGIAGGVFVVAFVLVALYVEAYP